MDADCRLVLAILIALMLLAGCGQAAPTAAPAPPTDMPAPPTVTPVAPTATPVPPTMTAIPPTDTPVPPTPTPTNVPPTPTAGPTPSPGSFVDSGQRLGNLNSWDVSLGDLDGDGDLDALVGNEGRTAVWVNEGGAQGGTPGVFANSGQSLGSASGVELGDMDGDGDLDAFIVDDHQVARVWLNDGAGFFSDSGQRLEGTTGLEAALGDLDGDGDLDAFVACNRANSVWFNDGSGAFVDSGQSLGEAITADVALGDLDGDGDLDALAGGWNEPAKVWFNDGTGAFVKGDHDLSSAVTHIHGIDLGDLDNDGDLDAFMATASGGGNEVWFNDGAGVFIRSDQSLRGSYNHAVSLGDLDGDGDLDAFVAQGAPVGSSNTVWLNAGGMQGGTPGNFVSRSPRLGDASSLGVALGDMDGDGDLDAFVANMVFSDSEGSRANKVWLNATPSSARIFPRSSTPV